MNATVPPKTAPVVEYARYLRALHGLDLQGKHDGEEADAIRDEMDAPWYAMSSVERERMGGLSEDLYSLAEGGPPRAPMSEQQIQAWKKELEDSRVRYLQGDIDGWLAFWRKARPNSSPAPDGIPTAIVHFLQAHCWDRLQDYETAALFRKAAENLVMEQLAQVA